MKADGIGPNLTAEDIGNSPVEPGNSAKYSYISEGCRFAAPFYYHRRISI